MLDSDSKTAYRTLYSSISPLPSTLLEEKEDRAVRMPETIAINTSLTAHILFIATAAQLQSQGWGEVE